MKVTLGDKLGAGLDKLRLHLPIRAEEKAPKPIIGVVVPDPVPHSPKPTQHSTGIPLLDEGQLAGDLLEWLFDKGFFKKTVTRTSLLAAQRRFFEERDR